MNEKMLAVVFHHISEGITIEEVPTPHAAKPDDISVEIRACGICGTDLAILEGRHPSSPPVILGHESTGQVVEVGKEVSNISVGDHVVVDPNITCGVCRYCRSQKQNLCQDMYTLGIHQNGAYARYMLAPEKAVYKIPEDMNWRDAALAEPLSCVVNGLQRSRIRPGESVAVFGAGPMGLLWIGLLKKVGAGVIIAVELKERRKKAAEMMGADYIIDPQEQDPIIEISKITDGVGVDVGVEMVGSITTVEQAIKSTRYGGRTVLMGTTHGDAEASFLPYNIMRYEREILGAYISNGTFPTAIEVLHRRLINSDVMITHDLPLNEIHRAFELFRKGEVIKALIRPV